MTITTEGVLSLSATGDGQRFADVAYYDRNGLVHSDLKAEITSNGTSRAERRIIVNGDMYWTLNSSEWAVLSPWHQGTRPGDMDAETAPGQLVDYDRMAENLEAIQEYHSEENNGTTYHRYTGRLDIDSFFNNVGSFYSGEVELDLWLDARTNLPHRIVSIATSLRGSDGSSTSWEGTQTFDYDAPPDPPIPPLNATPWRELEFPRAPCSGELFEDCLAPQQDLTAISTESCEGVGRRICFVPVGQFPTELVTRLVDYYRNQFGLEIQIMTPIEAPVEAFSPQRSQVDAQMLFAGAIETRWPENTFDREAVIIGLTPLDMYDSRSHFRYVFGIKWDYEFPKAVVSMFRMTPEFYGAPPDPELTFERTRKLVDKYIGLLYYGLPTTSDPTSPMYDNILGPDDLDRMTKPLPIEDILPGE